MSFERKYLETQVVGEVDRGYHAIPHFVKCCLSLAVLIFFIAIYLDDQLVGEMNYMVDPPHLYKKEPGTAWIGITIGDAAAQGKGVGRAAMQFLEEQIRAQGLKRIELGVFEFNTRAHHLYQKLGYQEIGRVAAFTYWDDKMWADIRMEKYLE